MRVRGRVLIVGAVVGVVVGGLAWVPSVRAAAPPVVGRLEVGQAVFWDGSYVERGRVEDDHLCDSAAGKCFDYELDVVAGHEAPEDLRVAIDQPSRQNTWAITVYNPSGTAVASGNTSGKPGSGAAAPSLTIEVFVEKPVLGAYRIHVASQDVDASTFRMRAKLEGPPPTPPKEVVPLLPHLRAVPPYEFTFTAPANPLNGLYPPDTANPPLSAAGVSPLSCTADETEQDGVTRCLRFTSGPFEDGGGPFEIDFDFVGDNAAMKPQTAYQVVHYSDGHTTSRAAGTYTFHTIHGHFHYEGILQYQLFKVTDEAKGTMEPAGAGHKSGFCPADEQIGEWTKFNQAHAGTYNNGSVAQGGNCFSPSKGFLGLSTGWGDVYRWQRPGQYVDFGTNGDGYYVVRSIVDHDKLVLGTQNDNVSYSYIHIVGTSVDIIERGLGASPWDKHKQVVPSLGGPLR